MDILQRAESREGCLVVILARDLRLINQVSSLGGKILSSINELTKKPEPKAIVLDKELATTG
jgi:hypothetical protein